MRFCTRRSRSCSRRSGLAHGRTIEAGTIERSNQRPMRRARCNPFGMTLPAIADRWSRWPSPRSKHATPARSAQPNSITPAVTRSVVRGFSRGVARAVPLSRPRLRAVGARHGPCDDLELSVALLEDVLAVAGDHHRVRGQIEIIDLTSRLRAGASERATLGLVDVRNLRTRPPGL